MARSYGHLHELQKGNVGLEVVGDAPISGQDWGTVLDLNHRQYSKEEFDLRQPFIELSWIIWPKGEVLVGAHEQKFIPFVIANPKDRYHVEASFGVLPELIGKGGGMVYVGFRHPDKRPEALVRIPTAWPILHFTSSVQSSIMPSNNEFRNPVINKEVTDGTIKFRLRLSSRKYVIPPQNIHPAQLVRQDEWEDGRIALQDLFYGRTGWNRAEPVKKEPLMNVPK